MPATLKIIKVLIEELQAAGGANSQLSPTEIEKLEEAGSDDGSWEDDPDMLDLGAGTTKQGTYFCGHEMETVLIGQIDLMALAEDNPYAQRQRDDETQAYLIEFFHGAAAKPGFDAVFAALTEAEQEKLRSYG